MSDGKIMKEILDRAAKISLEICEESSSVQAKFGEEADGELHDIIATRMLTTIVQHVIGSHINDDDLAISVGHQLIAYGANLLSGEEVDVERVEVVNGNSEEGIAMMESMNATKH